MALLRAQQHYIPRQVQTAALGITPGIVCAHNDRISVGTGNIAGSTLTAASGPNFSPGWVGSQMAINGGLYAITGYTSPTVITLGGGPPAGACGWEMILYPANTYNPGTFMFESDRSVFYRIGTSTGTVNTNGTTVTWISGPKFSPYWGGLTITINGVNYVISYTTQTTMTITTSAGVQAGVTWSVANADWFYAAGVMEGTTSAKPSDLDYNNDYKFLFHDLTLVITYIWQYDAGVGGGYFSYWSGLAALTLAQAQALTLRATDVNYQVWVTDYQHHVVWSGANWSWGPSEGSVGSVVAFTTTPHTGVWGFCDGSTYLIMDISAGALVTYNLTTPDMRSDTFMRGGT